MLPDEAIEALRAKKGASPVTIVTKTLPDMKKKNNPYYDDVIKVSRVNCIINWIYANAVKKVDPTFVPKPRKWGTRNGPFVEHTDYRGETKFYLEAKVERVLGTVFLRISSGEQITEDQIKPFLCERKFDSRIVVRDYDVKNIISLTMDKQTYLDPELEDDKVSD